MKNLRRMPLVLALVVALVVTALSWLASWRNSQAAPAPAVSSDTAFKGKLVLVNTDKAMMMMSNFLLEKVQVQRIGDRSFLVGKGAAEGRMGAGYKDRTVRINVEHIVSIIEFDDVKEATKALQQSGGMTMYGGGYGGFAPTTPPVPVAIPGDRAIPKAPPPPPPPPVKEIDK